MICQKSLHESCRMGRRIVVMKLICSLGHCECDGHTVHRLSQRRLTADSLAPRERECSQKHSNVSSDRLPSYIKATRPVLEIFKIAGHFPDSPGVVYINGHLLWSAVLFHSHASLPAGWTHQFRKGPVGERYQFRGRLCARTLHP
jgi:hypothetical protein